MGDEAEGFVSWRWLAAIAVTVIMALTGNWAINLDREVSVQAQRQATLDREHAMILTTMEVLKESMVEIRTSLGLIQTDMRHMREQLSP